MKPTLRARLTLTFAALFGGLLIPFLVFVYLYLSSWLSGQLKEQTRHDFDQIMIVFTEHREWRGAAEELYREEADEFNIQIRIIEAGRPIFHSYGLDGREYRIENDPGLVVPERNLWLTGTLNGESQLIYRGGFTYLGKRYACEIWKSRAEFEAIRRKLVFILGVGVPFILALSVMAGTLFARRALAPVEELRERADSIGHDLSARLPLPRKQDELHRLASTLNSLLARIEGSFESMKRFTADASHELRIPLTNLRGIMEVNLSKKRSPEEHEEDMRDALGEVHRLIDLISDLLLLAQVDAKKLTIQKKDVDLGILMADVVEEGRRLDDRGTRRVALTDVVNAKFPLDEGRVRQVLMILLENAVKHTAADGNIRLGAFVRGNNLEISVTDDGEGIPPEEHERIFERFYRVDKSRSRQEGGTGLGLAIARAIAEGHGGRITVDSAPGRGSAFTLIVPIK